MTTIAYGYKPPKQPRPKLTGIAGGPRKLPPPVPKPLVRPPAHGIAHHFQAEAGQRDGVNAAVRNYHNNLHKIFGGGVR
jgi:hypothetical protein